MPSAVDPYPRVNPWIVATAVMFATFMEVLDTTVVNVSLPHIAGSLPPVSLLVPIFLQTLLGYPALDAGGAMAPRGLGSFLMMPVVSTVLGRFDPRKVLAVGLVAAAWTLYELSRLNLNAGYRDIFWPQFILGASLAMKFVPLTTATPTCSAASNCTLTCSPWTSTRTARRREPS